MNIGVVYPQYEYEQSPAAVADFARTVEGLGYQHVLAYEHVLGANPQRPGGWRGPYTYQHAFLSPLVLFAYWAGLTTGLEFLTGILILPQRQTALVAKQAATLDVLAGGRLRLGIGVGWNEVEYESLGYDFHQRGRRVEEQIDLMRRLWAEPLVSFEGEWDTIPDAGIEPRPLRGDIPIWMGGGAEVLLQRVARTADGWLPNSSTPANARPKFDKLAQYVEQAGRNADEIGIEVRLPYGEGDPGQWVAQLEDWQSMGVTHIAFNTLGAGFTTAGQHLKAIRTFAEETGLPRSRS